jgi:hypothetical protein
VDITYKGPDGQSKKDSADLPYDQRCGNIPGYKCLNPAGTVPNQMRVCLRQCDTGKPTRSTTSSASTIPPVQCRRDQDAGQDQRARRRGRTSRRA